MVALLFTKQARMENIFMKKSFLLKLVLALSLFSLSQFAFSEEVKSLRDDNIETLSEKADWKKVPTDFQHFERAYEEQPPLIRHFIEGFTITSQLNDCLECHSPSSHFTDGDDDVLSEISNRYYFCTQCHVSQITEEPLRNNTFENGSE